MRDNGITAKARRVPALVAEIHAGFSGARSGQTIRSDGAPPRSRRPGPEEQQAADDASLPRRDRQDRYSALSTVNVSTALARLAGIHAATTATRRRPSAAANQTAGSCASIW